MNILVFVPLSGNYRSAWAEQTAAAPLSLEQALALALAQDRGQRRYKAMADSFSHKAVTVRRWPDPLIKLGMANFPTDTFARDQEPMTQVKLGVQQKFPKGKTLELKSAQTSIESSRYLLLQHNQQLLTRRALCNVWLELLYWIKAEVIVRKNQSYLHQALRITRDQYRSGRRAQQDVIRVQLEIDLVKDRIIALQARQQQARATLGHWIGQARAAGSLLKDIPGLPALPLQSEFMSKLKTHPLLLSNLKNVAARSKNIAIARQAYKPGFSLELSYGDRENRPDFASIGLGVSVPLFKKKKYDAQLQAARSGLSAAVAVKDDVYSELVRQYYVRSTVREKLAVRNNKYRQILLPRAHSNAKVSVSASRNGCSDFNTLIRARVMELDIELKALRILIDYLKSQSDLLYLAGVMK